MNCNLESLSIVNFQSHKDTALKLSSGLNIITGETDCGKSAIVRALDWLFNNNPAGDEYRSDWGGTTRVSAKFQTKGRAITIERVKGKGFNGYRVDGNEFKALGRGVPRHIQDLFAMADINFSFQHDTPYMVYDSGGAAARELGKAAGLDKADALLHAVISKERAIAADRARLWSEYKEHKKAAIELREKYAIVEKDWNVIAKANKEACALRFKAESLSALVCEYEKLEKLPAVPACVFERMKYVERDIKARSELKNKTESLSGALMELRNIEKEAGECDEKLRILSGKLSKVKPTVCPFKKEWHRMGGTCQERDSNI